jgi:hypothetical protein
MGLKLNRHSVTLPAGRYLIIDPCDSLPDGEWDRVIDLTNCFEDPCHAAFTTAAGGQGLVVAFSTANGDGCFADAEGNEYGVDSGVIGIVSMDDLTIDEGDVDGGVVHDFTAPFRCYRSGDTLVFGHIEINTGNTEEEDSDFGDFDNDY